MIPIRRFGSPRNHRSCEPGGVEPSSTTKSPLAAQTAQIGNRLQLAPKGCTAPLATGCYFSDWVPHLSSSISARGISYILMSSNFSNRFSQLLVTPICSVHSDALQGEWR
jgi:hypothetical protein